MADKDQDTKRKYTAEEIKNATKSNAPKLEEPIFPYYGVKCVWLGSNGNPIRTIEEFYPEGKEKELFPWEMDDDKSCR